MIFLRFIGVWFAIVRWFIAGRFANILQPVSSQVKKLWAGRMREREREREDLAGGDRSCLAYRGVFKHRANDHKLSLGSGWSDKNGRDWEDWSFRERVAGECVTVTRYIHLQCSQGVIITLIWDREQSQAASICQYPSQHHTHNHHHNTQHTTQLSTSLYL